MGCKNIKVMTDCCLGPDFAIVLFFHLLCLGSRIVQSETMLQNECSKMFIILTFCVWTVETCFTCGTVGGLSVTILPVILTRYAFLYVCSTEFSLRTQGTFLLVAKRIVTRVTSNAVKII